MLSGRTSFQLSNLFWSLTLQIRYFIVDYSWCGELALFFNIAYPIELGQTGYWCDVAYMARMENFKMRDVIGVWWDPIRQPNFWNQSFFMNTWASPCCLYHWILPPNFWNQSFLWILMLFCVVSFIGSSTFNFTPRTSIFSFDVSLPLPPFIFRALPTHDCIISFQLLAVAKSSWNHVRASDACAHCQ